MACLGGRGADFVDTVADDAGKHDVVLNTTMGSKARFEAGAERVPDRMQRRLQSSLLVLHVPV